MGIPSYVFGGFAFLLLAYICESNVSTQTIVFLHFAVTRSLTVVKNSCRG